MKQVKFITDNYLKSLVGKQFNVGNFDTPIVCTCKSILRFKNRLIVLTTEDKSQFDYTNVEFVKSIIQ